MIRFARIGDSGAKVPVAAVDDVVYDLRPITADIDGAFLAADPLMAVQAALADGRLPLVEALDQRFGPPIVRPAAIIAIGMNYAAHAAESSAAPPDQPMMFLKHPNTLSGPNDAVTIPRGSVATDWEVELGVVIGRRASYLDSIDAARDHIAGFALANDLSERTFQLEISGGQWSKGKCAPGFTPLGPWLVPRAEAPDGPLTLRSWVNDDPRQSSTTADMVFSVDHLVWDLSQYVTLEPGDLILTGTPQGVGLSGRFPYLYPGDVCELDGGPLGRQRQIYREWRR